MLDEQNQLRFGHTDKFESLDWLAVANIQKPKANFNRPTVTTRSSREPKPQPQPQPPARPNPSQPQPVTPQVPPRGRRSGRDPTRGNTTDNGEGPSEDKRLGRSRREGSVCSMENEEGFLVHSEDVRDMSPAVTSEEGSRSLHPVEEAVSVMSGPEELDEESSIDRSPCTRNSTWKLHVCCGGVKGYRSAL
ncbi:hypothetical protein CEP53_007208 [Fusarium sp. AF-6]|nr:hypothetical protein CEP53_007208 [Fusarium sp. AF-6]